MADEIIYGDCLEVMQEMKENRFDAIVTDPPYGIDFKYGNEKERFDNPDDYWGWLKPRFEEMRRILKEGGFFACWQPHQNFKFLWEWFGNDIHIYAACKSFVQLNRNDRHGYPITYGHEPIVMKYIGKPYLTPRKKDRNLDWSIGHTHKYILDTESLVGKHPCPRPLNQVSEIISNFVIEGGLVLDPFLGSGTTAVVCEKLNRGYVGVEINQKYIEIAKNRIKNIQNSKLEAFF